MLNRLSVISSTSLIALTLIPAFMACWNVNTPPLLRATLTPLLLTPTPITLDGRVDVGGYKLYLNCAGEGSPTVVLDAGLGTLGITWTPIQSKVARFTRVCYYDRAGMGRSDLGPKPRTSQQIVSELHMLLVNASIAGPYVLVGHSFGGLNVRLYTSQYPEEVVGIVLVDSAHEDQATRYWSTMPPEAQKQMASILMRNPEGIDWEESAAQVRDTGSLGDIPLVVLTAGKPTHFQSISAEEAKQLDQVWLDLQNDLANLSSNSTHLIAEESDHFIQRDQPELVITAIKQLIEATRP